MYMYICLWADGRSGFLGPLSHKDGRYASVRSMKSLLLIDLLSLTHS